MDDEPSILSLMKTMFQRKRHTVLANEVAPFCPCDATNPYAFPIPTESPFPPKSDFAKLFAILYEYRDIGISRPDLALCFKKWTSKDIPESDYDVKIFLSAMMNGIPHWITEKNGVIKLHLKRPV